MERQHSYVNYTGLLREATYYRSMYDSSAVSNELESLRIRVYNGEKEKELLLQQLDAAKEAMDPGEGEARKLNGEIKHWSRKVKSLLYEVENLKASRQAGLNRYTKVISVLASALGLDLGEQILEEASAKS